MGTMFRNYVKRLRMHREMSTPIAAVSSVDGFELVPWEPTHLAIHADVMVNGFRDSMDSRLFPNLTRYESCVDLMRVIAGHEQFLPSATWLIRHHSGQFVAGVQALGSRNGVAIIQNLAVRVGFQGRGLGKILLAASLRGMREIGVTEARLEVSAKNVRAVRLYHTFDFHQMKTLYRETKSEAWDYTI